MSEISMNVVVVFDDVHSLSGQIVHHVYRDDVVTLIKALDSDLEDLDATNELYEHFKSLHETYLAEVKE